MKLHATPSGLVYVFCRGRTWIADNMVRPDRIPIATAPSKSAERYPLVEDFCRQSSSACSSAIMVMIVISSPDLR
jgi:hypothetical protein